MLRTRLSFASLALALATFANAGPITIIDTKTSHYTYTGTFVGFGNPDGILASAYDDGSSLSVVGRGAATTQFLAAQPANTASGQAFSLATVTFKVGSEPVQITSASLAGSMRTVTSGGPLVGGSTITDTARLAYVLEEGPAAFTGPELANFVAGNAPSIGNNSFADGLTSAPLNFLVGVKLTPYTTYSLSVAAGSFYGFHRNAGDNFTYGITNEFGGIGNPFNFGQASLTYQALPEPASMAILGVGVAAMLRRKRK